MSPSTYLSLALQNRDIKQRIETFSLEQALYFEPYQEADMDIKLVQALRRNDLTQIQSCDDDTLQESRNHFGENLVHLACRLNNVSKAILTYLVKERNVSLNVRDRYGRSPLHNVCMLAVPDFEMVAFLLERAPRLLLFEDDYGKTPFECIPSRCYDRWIRFLSEQHILKRVACELGKV
jgi:ankyrin repeat protein